MQVQNKDETVAVLTHKCLQSTVGGGIKSPEVWLLSCRARPARLPAAEKVAKYWKTEKLPMIGAPDEDGKLAHLYGQEWKLLKLGRMPALFLIDRKGNLAFVQYGKTMSDIPKNGEMLKVLDGLRG